MGVPIDMLFLLNLIIRIITYVRIWFWFALAAGMRVERMVGVSYCRGYLPRICSDSGVRF